MEVSISVIRAKIWRSVELVAFSQCFGCRGKIRRSVGRSYELVFEFVLNVNSAKLSVSHESRTS